MAFSTLEQVAHVFEAWPGLSLAFQASNSISKWAPLSPGRLFSTSDFAADAGTRLIIESPTI
ncbi:hypothetical protein B5K11_24405 [Rhizobium leguminosarum bv. trifolii]|nr:hypothetical protein B5K11_24405 [Rhizobium leguminosarum bv. trifolii]